jgi:hypothetical protein
MIATIRFNPDEKEVMMPQYEYAKERLGFGMPWAASKRMQDMINRWGATGWQVHRYQRWKDGRIHTVHFVRQKQ